MTGKGRISSQFVRFATVGGIATGIQYIILFALVRQLDMNAVWASGIGFVVSGFCNYLLNYRFTFQSNARHRLAVSKFFAVAGVGLGLNSLVMQIATATLGLHYLAAQLVATALVLIWNFLANRCWVFKPA
jgi:putative flippase GtrA